MHTSFVWPRAFLHLWLYLLSTVFLLLWLPWSSISWIYTFYYFIFLGHWNMLSLWLFFCSSYSFHLWIYIQPSCLNLDVTSPKKVFTGAHSEQNNCMFRHSLQNIGQLPSVFKVLFMSLKTVVRIEIKWGHVTKTRRVPYP